MSYLSHRSFAIPALENHVTFFLLLTGSPAQPARKHAGKITPVLSLKSRTPARTAASLDVIFPLRSPHGSQHGSPQAIPQGNLHRVQRSSDFQEQSTKPFWIQLPAFARQKLFIFFLRARFFINENYLERIEHTRGSLIWRSLTNTHIQLGCMQLHRWRASTQERFRCIRFNKNYYVHT